MTDNDLTDASRRVTNNDIGRRLEHVEGIQEQQGVRIHELAGHINVIGLKVEHSQEMIRVRFGGLEAKVDTSVAKLDALLDASHAQHADPSATPAGRQVLEDIETLREWQREHKPILDGARSVMGAWRIIAGGSILTTASAIVAVLAALGAFSQQGPL